MGYTREDILQKINTASENMVTFYKKPFINYRGKTTDTNEYYSEIVAEWCLDNLEYFQKIPCITRKSNYKVKGHDGIVKNGGSNRTEELIAKAMKRQEILFDS